MTITSTAFQHNDYIPAKYTCDGENINPPLTFSEIPKGTESLILIVDDPDAPTGNFIHWVLYNMPPATLQILENQVPPNTKQGLNSGGTVGYYAPCPPSGTHRYVFQLFALDNTLDLPNGSTKESVQHVMQNHILDSASIIGLYKKNT